jgi:transposase
VAHPGLRVRDKILVLWLLHCRATREEAAWVVGVSRSTVQRDVAAFRAGGLDGPRRCDRPRPQSAMAADREVIRASLEERPARTMAEACKRKRSAKPYRLCGRPC